MLIIIFLTCFRSQKQWHQRNLKSLLEKTQQKGKRKLSKILMKQYRCSKFFVKAQTKLHSVLVIRCSIIPIVKSGKAASVLKATSARRKTKEEQKQDTIMKEKEKYDVQTMNNVKSMLASKRAKIEDIPMFIEQHDRLIDYLKSKNIMDSDGNINAQQFTRTLKEICKFMLLHA
eukprot:TRINITY_DN81204_c0_g1_i1.p2 TRINITY_DN81204_c0_g1~~TRINITY_DN81204_c0_g1_i1.p2  ORF type:complete len:174 (+),score=7.83 TRINITY_DN81204_c0_g1_i1:241-762(+)